MDRFVKAIIQIENIRFYKNEWGIILVSEKEIKSGELESNEYGEIVLKGNMNEPKIGNTYSVILEKVIDETWGLQYHLVSMVDTNSLNTDTEKGQRKFLEHIFTISQVENMYKALDNPFESFKNRKYEDLIKISGCGITNATKWQNKFDTHLSLARVYIELEEYNLTDNLIKKLISKYKNVELMINKVKNNPYLLCEIDGIGWSTADRIARAGGIGEYDSRRIGGCILQFLKTQGSNGNSYSRASDIMEVIIGNIGEDVSDGEISKAFTEIEDLLWWNEDKSLIGLKYYRELEYNIAKRVQNLNKETKNNVPKSWQKEVETLEREQGWEFTDEQKQGIETILNNNITIVQGYGGTGKTSLVSAVLRVLKDKKVAMCALSGKAALRMTEVSNIEGQTIHRLLGYPSNSPFAKDGFTYHNEHQLKYDIIIVDEISMIGGWLFYALIRAINKNTKVIMLGDLGQLEAIGECNVAKDLIQSNKIPTVFLTQIHRQAKASGIVTESINIRNGLPIVSTDFAGVEVRGELKDMLIDVYSDSSNTLPKIVEHFKEELQLVDNILKIQILSPTKTRGKSSNLEINRIIQDYYNPSKGQNELIISKPNNQELLLREGDKIINVVNNYDTVDIDGNTIPVYNGNIGIIKNIIDEDYVIIYFQNIGNIVMSKVDLKNVELGYAITVHKSQGSEWERVIVGIDYGAYSLLCRELVYTAITRAKKHCTLVCQNSALAYCTKLEKTSIKLTHLKEILLSM